MSVTTKQIQEMNIKTLKHIETVSLYINKIIKMLKKRALNHDKSKLESPEAEIFAKFTPMLANSTYDSDEYKQFLINMKSALDHHYANNRHHPEHFKIWVCRHCQSKYDEKPEKCSFCSIDDFYEDFDISKMNIIDLVEMLCDWKAAVERHNDGNIDKSLQINIKRFNISDQLAAILKNSLHIF